MSTKVTNQGALIDMDALLVGISTKKMFSVKADGIETDPIKVEIEYDFSQVPVKYLLAKALRTIIIDTQRKLRELGTEGIKAMNGKMQVALTPNDGKRMKMTPTEQVVKGFSKMTSDQKQELLDELTKQISK
tara:strand:+ start:438 stop:833 length:396 start_codon:yes stop_codon:yes gene_type:complete